MSEKRLCVAVIFGGRSGEHDVSLQSARSVIAALDRSKYQILEIGITRTGTWLHGDGILEALSGDKVDQDSMKQVIILPGTGSNFWEMHDDGNARSITPLPEVDVVFPVLHGTFGEDGTLQGLLEMADLAYVGAGVTGSSVGMDKGVFKDVMRANGIPTVESLIVLRPEIEKDLDNVVERSEKISAYPLFVKPANLGSSVGISKCNSRADLVEGLQVAAEYDRRVLIERGVEAREIEVSVLGNDDPQASVPGEILPSREFYSYESKYVDGTSGLEIPASLPQGIPDEIRRLAVKAYSAIDCSGMARVDFFLERSSGKVYLNELNSIPGFTSISMYPKLWEASGLPYPDLLGRLISLALERKSERDRTKRDFGRKA